MANTDRETKIKAIVQDRSHKDGTVYDYSMSDMSKWTREELYGEVLLGQRTVVNALCKLEWVFGAFMNALQTDFKFGKQRMKKLLKCVQKLFNYFDCFPGDPIDFEKYLESFGFKMFFHGGKILLRDLEAPEEEYFSYLMTDLEELAQKLKTGQELTDSERKVLTVMKEGKDA